MSDARIRALIVDDEPLARARLRGLLAKHADMQLVGECAEGGEAIATIDRMRPEVVFLDIQMTETSGLDVATTLTVEPRPAVVFVTAHESHALEAFDVQALDYLLKPFEEARFGATLERVRAYALAARAKRSHAHLVAILRELLAEVWGYSDDVSSRTVDTHIAVLRRKLGHGATDAGYIATVAKAGYRILA